MSFSKISSSVILPVLMGGLLLSMLLPQSSQAAANISDLHAALDKLEQTVQQLRKEPPVPTGAVLGSRVSDTLLLDLAFSPSGVTDRSGYGAPVNLNSGSTLDVEEGLGGYVYHLTGASDFNIHRSQAQMYDHEEVSYVFTLKHDTSGGISTGEVFRIHSSQSILVRSEVTFEFTNTAGERFVVRSSGANLSEGWHHVVVTYNSLEERITLYVDGKKVGEGIATGKTKPRESWGANFGFGSGERFRGSIGEFQMHSLALSESEIASRAAAFAAKVGSSPAPTPTPVVEPTPTQTPNPEPNQTPVTATEPAAPNAPATNGALSIDAFKRDKHIFDRGLARGENSADVPLSGTAPAGAVIEARTVEVSGSRTASAWKTIATTNSQGNWSGTYTRGRSTEYLRAEARVKTDSSRTVATTNTFGVGTTIALHGQSNENYWIKFQGAVMEDVLDDTAVQLIEIDRASDPTNSTTEITFVTNEWKDNQRRLANGTIYGAGKVAFANMLSASLPGEKFLVKLAVVSGTGLQNEVQDRTDATENPKRLWVDEIRLHKAFDPYYVNAGTPTKMGLMLWAYTSASALVDVESIYVPMMVGIHRDGTKTGSEYDHTLAEMYDWSHTKFGFGLANSHEQQINIVNIKNNPHYASFVAGLGYGIPGNVTAGGLMWLRNGSIKDTAHPSVQHEDGSVRRARLTAVNILMLLGVTTERSNIWNSTTAEWGPVVSGVRRTDVIRLSRPQQDFTTLRRIRGWDRLVPDGTWRNGDVDGFFANNEPLRKVEIRDRNGNLADRGDVWIYKNDGSAWTSADNLSNEIGQGSLNRSKNPKDPSFNPDDYLDFRFASRLAVVSNLRKIDAIPVYSVMLPELVSNKAAASVAAPAVPQSSVNPTTPTPTQSIPTIATVASGDRVRVTERVNVRDPYGTGGTILGVQEVGALGTVLTMAPQSANGYTWVPVNFDSGADGWVANEFLVRVSEVATPVASQPVVTPSSETVSAPPATGSYVTSVSERGITWYFKEPALVGRYITGDYWVMGPVEVTRITPDAGNDMHGWMVNPLDDKKQAFHSSTRSTQKNTYDRTLMPSLPYTANPGDSLIKAITNSNDQRFRTDYASVLTVVDIVPPSDAFRPAYAGTKKDTYRVSELRTNLLPSAVPSSINVPSWSEVEGYFNNGPWIDFITSHPGEIVHPSFQMGRYGGTLQFQTSNAILRLMMNDPLAQKLPTLQWVVQYAIDLEAMMLETGTDFPPNGGHAGGRKLPLTLAAVLLDDPEMTALVKDAPKDQFNENGKHLFSQKANNGQGIVLMGDATDKGNESQYWTLVETGNGFRTAADPYGYIDGSVQPIESYLLVLNVAPWKASVIALQLMPSLKPVWNDEDFVTVTKRYVSGGQWTQPDPCAPVERDAQGKAVAANRGVTYGPDGQGGCILDTDPSDGIGRFPNLHLSDPDAASKRKTPYDIPFADALWPMYINVNPNDVPNTEALPAPTEPAAPSAPATNGALGIDPILRDKHIFDRGLARGENSATIPLSGTAPAGAVIEARTVEVSGSRASTPWRVIATAGNDGRFAGTYTRGRSTEYLRAEARVQGTTATVATTNTFGVGTTIALHGQSNEVHWIKFTGLPTEVVIDDDAVQFVDIARQSGGPAGADAVKVRMVTNTEPLATPGIKAFANALISGVPGEKFIVKFATVSGSGIQDEVQDRTDSTESPVRFWADEVDLHRAFDPYFTAGQTSKTGLLLWAYTSASNNSDMEADYVPMMLGIKRNGTPTGSEYDHTLAEMYDWSHTKLGFIPYVDSIAQTTSIQNLPENTNYAPFLATPHIGLSRYGIQHGELRNGVYTDLTHPGIEHMDGTTRAGRTTAFSALMMLGAVDVSENTWDKVVIEWGPTVNGVKRSDVIRISKPEHNFTTLRRARGETRLTPDGTWRDGDVYGFWQGTVPLQKAQIRDRAGNIADKGDVWLFKNDGSAWTANDRASYAPLTSRSIRIVNPDDFIDVFTSSNLQVANSFPKLLTVPMMGIAQSNLLENKVGQSSSGPAPLPTNPTQPTPTPTEPAPVVEPVTPTPTQPTPVTATVAAGDRIRVTERVNVRDPYGTNSPSIGLQEVGALGTVLTIAPQSANGFTWVPVNFDSGADGWVAESFVGKVTIAPTPAPTPTPTPTTPVTNQEAENNNPSEPAPTLSDRRKTVTNAELRDKVREHRLELARQATKITKFLNRRESELKRDTRFTYPLGLYDFAAEVEPGSTETVTITLDALFDTSDWEYRKYNGTTDRYTDISDQVTYGTTNLNGTDVTTITYEIEDNGPLDTDDRLGFIADPAGPALPEGEEVVIEEEITTNNSGGSSGGGGGSRSSSSGGSSSANSNTTSVNSSTGDISLVSANISFNQPSINTPTAVNNVLRFLNTFEGENLPLDGSYDVTDNAAVQRFQLKYKKEILDIWNLTEATGYVGITTRLKMNFLIKGATAECPAFVEYNGGLSGIMFSPEIGKTQTILKDLGMYRGGINNTWDASTNQALITFQETFREVMLDPWNITEGTGYKYKTTNLFLNYFAGCDTGAVELEGVGRFEI